MKRKLTSILLMSALLVGGASTFVSCKDYDEDQTAVNNAELAKLQTSVKKNYDDLKLLIDGKQDDLGENLNVLLDELDKTIKNADDAKAWVEANTKVQTLATHVQALATLAGDQETLTKLATWLKNSSWNTETNNIVLKSELLEYVKQDELPDWETLLADYEKIADMQKDVTDIINGITAANSENYTTYADLVKAFEGVPERLEEVEKQMDQLLAWQDAVTVTLENMITGVNVDMVENPYFGTLNTPFGIQSTMLIGFVGDDIESTEFAGQIFGEEEAPLTSEDGGSIYFTVNPSNVDMEGLHFTLVGRDGEEAPGYALGAAVKDNTPVTTVSTRAAGPVNSYKAVAGITDGKKAMVNVNKEDLKKVAKNVLGKLKGEESLDVTNAVMTIYSTFANAIPEYYALQAAYKIKQKTGEDAEGNDVYEFVDRHYTSDFNIAAVTVKPLGYETLDNVDFPHIPQIPLLQDWLNANITEIKYDPMNPNEIKDVKVEIPNGKNIKVIYEGQNGEGKVILYPVEGGTGVEMDFSKITVTGETLVVWAEMDQVRDVVAKINTQISGMVGDVNKLFGNAEDLAGSADKYINKANSVISKVNKFLDNAGEYVKPVMLAACNGGAFRLSEIEEGAPTVKANGENAIVLIPTSYTLELLAPAYKKSVKVNGKEVNASLDGKVKTINANLVEGMNTIEYSAMDYYGIPETRTYFINVVK